jgi:hypothetical protein
MIPAARRGLLVFSFSGRVGRGALRVRFFGRGFPRRATATSASGSDHPGVTSNHVNGNTALGNGVNDLEDDNSISCTHSNYLASKWLLGFPAERI